MYHDCTWPYARQGGFTCLPPAATAPAPHPQRKRLELQQRSNALLEELAELHEQTVRQQRQLEALDAELQADPALGTGAAGQRWRPLRQRLMDALDA